MVIYLFEYKPDSTFYSYVAFARGQMVIWLMKIEHP